ncbi:hypothetical protein [Serratia sp. 201]|uniref:hypothetical protein n=1 Tax=Serratia sp. 201 TaxID=3096764 RepID=UPI00300862C7
MTVSTEVSREEYTGNGVTTDFDYRFRVFSADELVVTVADTTENIRTLVLNTDYTVTGAGSRNGGKVKLASALANNWRISIERELPVTQETDVRNQGNFFPEVHEDAWDKLTMLIQQAIGGLGLALRKPNWLAKYYDAKGNRIANLGNPINDQDAATKSYVDSVNDGYYKRTLRVPESSVNMLRPVAERNKSLLGFNDLGQPVPIFSMTDTADLAIRLASSTGANLVGWKDKTVGEYLDLFDRRVPYVTPEEFGAAGNGVIDDTAAFTAALSTGKNVYCSSTANYRITAQLVWPWMDSGQQSLFGNGAIITAPNLRTTVFAQRLADGSIQKTTIRKHYLELTLQGPVTTRDIYASVNGTDGFYISHGNLVRCKTIGFTTGASIMGHTTVQAFYADNMRNAALRSEGELNRVFGLTAGWTAGDTLIIKSDFSYYADIYAEYAGVIPKDTLEPGPQQGSAISFAQDGQNAGGNVVNGVSCRYYGAGAITVNGTENHVGGVLHIGRPADTSFAAVDRYDPAIYIGGTNCSIGDVNADFVYGGVHLHNGSVNCRIGQVNLGNVSDLNSYCQAFVASGVCTRCKVDGIYANGVAKNDSVYISMSDLYVGNISITNLNLPTSAGGFSIKILGACTINNINVSVNATSPSAINTIYIGGAAKISNLEMHNAFGTSVITANNISPILGRVLLNPRPDNTTRCIDLPSSDASATRYIGSLTVTGTTQPRANGTVHIGAYRGSAWLRSDLSKTLSVWYPVATEQVVTS